MIRPCIIVLIACTAVSGAVASDLGPRPGWQVIDTDLTHADLLDRLLAAVPAEGMGVVTQAGPTGAARSRGIEIPENRVVGVFNNDFAVRILGLSTAAMIEAPVRFYVTEDADGTATLSWKEPSFVFAPYGDDGGVTLAEITAELDARFAAIAARATADCPTVQERQDHHTSVPAQHFGPPGYHLASGSWPLCPAMPTPRPAPCPISSIGSPTRRPSARTRTA